MIHKSHLNSNEVKGKLRELSFNSNGSFSSQIKTQLEQIITIPKPILKDISFHLISPKKKKIIRIKSPDCRLSFPSTKSTQKTNISLHHQDISIISQFMLTTKKHNTNHKLQNINWLFQTATKLLLNRNVVYTTLYILQQYNRKIIKPLNEYKHITMTILWIVCKQQYQNHLGIKQCIHLLDYQITPQQLQDLEIDILKVLQFKLSHLTLYDRLLYHLAELKYIQIYSKNKINIFDILNSQNIVQYLSLCKRMDAIVMSNIHQSYSLDSIIYFLLKITYFSHYKSRQLKVFQRAYQSYWKNKYLLSQSFKLNSLNNILQNISFDQQIQQIPQGINHSQILTKQTFDPKLKQISLKIQGCMSFDNLLY